MDMIWDINSWRNDQVSDRHVFGSTEPFVNKYLNLALTLWLNVGCCLFRADERGESSAQARLEKTQEAPSQNSKAKSSLTEHGRPLHEKSSLIQFCRCSGEFGSGQSFCSMKLFPQAGVGKG